MKNVLKRILRIEYLINTFLVLFTLLLVGNLFSFLSMYMITGVNMFDASQIVAFKNDKLPETFRGENANVDAVKPCEFPHPFFGTLKTCGNENIPGEESLFSSRKNADSNTKKILIVGGCRKTFLYEWI